MMKAQVIRDFGSVEVFQIAEIATPAPGPTQVLIKVAATSINPVDYAIRTGQLEWAKPPLPAILHGDISGTIEQVGTAVRDFASGDEVYAYLGGVLGLGGGLADYVLAEASQVAYKPRSLSLAEAAALPTIGITAWTALIERANIQAGQTVLVHAASGGVGQIGIQLAKWKGAKVFTTASFEEKLAFARQIGVEGTINYRTTEVAEYVQQYTDGRGFEVVFDTVGGANLVKSLEAAATYGTVITIALGQTYDLTPVLFKALTLHGVAILLPLLAGRGHEAHGRILSQLAEVVDAGFVRPLLDPHQFTFSQVAEAHQLAESGQAIGKIVLTND